jgi:large subunit ribosomal protein L36
MTILSLSQLSNNNTSNLLKPTTSSSSSALTAVEGARGYKTKTALRLRCEHCFFARRRGKLRVICKENPKHKQVQM